MLGEALDGKENSFPGVTFDNTNTLWGPNIKCLCFAKRGHSQVTQERVKCVGVS